MSTPRRGLGRGLGALLPSAPAAPAATGSASAPAQPEAVAGPSSWTDRAPSPPQSRDGLVRRKPSDDAPGSATGGDGYASNGSSTTSPSSSDPAAAAHYAEIPVGAVKPNPRQPRRDFDPDALAELVASIAEVGLLQPVVVRPAGPGSFELVMGERRWRAAKAAGLDRLPAIVREAGDDAMLRDALLENLHRAELNPLEEAAAYRQLLDDFGCTHEELAARLSRSRPQVTNALRLLKLAPGVQRRVAAGVLSAGHARALAAVPDADAQERLAQRIVAEGLSVRALEELVAVGGWGSGPPSRRRSRRPAQLHELATILSERLETRVKVEMGRSKGKVVIEFASAADLDRIANLLGGSKSI